MAMQMAAMGLPPGLAHMMTAMTDNLVGGLEQTLYEKMSSNYQLIAKAVWAQLQKDAHGMLLLCWVFLILHTCHGGGCEQVIVLFSVFFWIYWQGFLLFFFSG